jgi:hypothetical protein
MNHPSLARSAVLHKKIGAFTGLFLALVKVLNLGQRLG